MRWFQRTPLEAARWVAIDCETSGLDARRDRLLSVGALAVYEGRVQPADSYSGLVAQTLPSSRDNILIHGISGDAQLAGRPAPEVIRELTAYIGERIPVGFHAPFDAAILRRHGLRLRRKWLDLAVLAPVLFRERCSNETSLEHWLAQFAIPVHLRHDALGDAFATAQLLLVVLAEARRQSIRTVEALFSVSGGGRWLSAG